MKTLFFLLTTLVSIIGIQCQAIKKNPSNDIIILYTNDVHCAIDKNIGYAGLSYYRKQVQELTPYVALVDIGDHNDKKEEFCLNSSGSNIIKVMNALNYDVATPGNHEFDYGVNQFKNFTEELKCEYVSCNFRKIENNELVLKPYKIMEYGDVKIAYVGASTPEAIAVLDPNQFVDSNGNFIYDFGNDDVTGEKLAASLQQAVDDARKEGADYVVVLGHNGETIDYPEYVNWSALFLVQHTNGIDVFIDGHSHETTPCLMQKNKDGVDVPITQSGSRLTNIGQVTIGKDGSIKTELIGPEKVQSKDENITQILEDIKMGKFVETVESGVFDGRNKLQLFYYLCISAILYILAY